MREVEFKPPIAVKIEVKTLREPPKKKNMAIFIHFTF
jgi:hypothetical protein